MEFSLLLICIFTSRKLNILSGLKNNSFVLVQGYRNLTVNGILK